MRIYFVTIKRAKRIRAFVLAPIICAPASREKMYDIRTPVRKYICAIENSYLEWFIGMESGRIRRTLLDEQDDAVGTTNYLYFLFRADIMSSKWLRSEKVINKKGVQKEKVK